MNVQNEVQKFDKSVLKTIQLKPYSSINNHDRLWESSYRDETGPWFS